MVSLKLSLLTTQIYDYYYLFLQYKKQKFKLQMNTINDNVTDYLTFVFNLAHCVCLVGHLNLIIIFQSCH